MKKNSLSKKGISVFLAVLIMLSAISVGIIVPETKLTAYAATANSYDTLKSAINAANSAGGTTTITLTGNISDSNTSRAALPTITSSVILDLAGYGIEFKYSGSGGNSDNYSYQLPSENAGSARAANAVLTKGMINVGTAGTLQIINSGTADSTMYCYTKYTKNYEFAWGSSDTYNISTSSHLLYSEGTLIIGDRNDSSKNNFTLYADSSSYSGDDSLSTNKVNTYTYACTVTVNNANAEFYMYGGNINVAATARGRYEGVNNCGCYGLYLANCTSAEIYGGNINVVKNADSTGTQCQSNMNMSNCVALFVALRVDGGTVYVFNLASSVTVTNGADSGSTKICCYATNAFIGGGTVYIYGLSASRTLSVSDTDGLSFDEYSIVGTYYTAQTETEKEKYSLPGNKSAQNITANPLTVSTHFYFGDGLAENGVYPWGDGSTTYHAYINAGTYKTDRYSQAIETVESTQNATATRSYLRNGYTHSGWVYNKIPGTAQTDSDVTSGSVFCYPTWNKNEYTVSYNLNDESGNGTASNQDGAVTTYNITSTSTLPLPTRNGYNFKGWELTKVTYPSTDTVSPWTLSETYDAGYSLSGKNGNIELKAVWEEITYTATFDYDNIPGGLSGTKTIAKSPYNINSTFSFPTDCQKNYYTFDKKWICTTGDGSWSAGSTEYTAGTETTSGAYGNPTFTAQYTPIDYLITFDTVNGASITPNYTTTGSNSYQYNYESTDTLPATTRLGYTFVGWKPDTAVADTNDSSLIVWDNTAVYPAGTSLNKKHGNITLVAQWESVSSTVTLNIKADETYTGNTVLDYAYSSSLALNNPTKTGYTFKGWKVTAVPESYSSDIPEANKWTINTEYPLGNETNVIIPAGKIGNVTLEAMWETVGYTVTYNSNGGSAVTAQDFDIEDSFALGTSTYPGYTFNGWSVSAHDDVYNWTSSSYSASQGLSGMYGSVTLLANWEVTAYTVTLDVNGGDALAQNTRSYNIEGVTALPTPTRTGFSFDGWKITSADGYSAWNAGDIYTDALPAGKYGSLTLTAQWTHTPFSIRLSSAGTNSGELTYYTDSDAFTLGTSSLAGYNFEYWKVNSTSGNWTKDEEIGGSTPVSGRYGNVSLTAMFTPITYTLTYKDKDGGTLETVSYDIEDTLNLRDYSVNGYTFGGWQVESVSSGGGWIKDGTLSAGELPANIYFGNVVLTPVMTANEYTLTFIPDGGTSFAPVTYTVLSEDTLPLPAKTGYDFAGWKVTVAGGSWTENAVFNASEALTGKYGTATLTATWTPKKYTITYFTGAYPSGITKQGTFGQTAPDLTESEKAKPQDAQYTYTFDKWSPLLATVTGEASYTAQYTKTLRSYDITWMLPDDVSGTLGNYTADSVININYGEAPVYNAGVNPTLTSADPDNYLWRFLGWSLTPGGTVLEGIPTVTGTAVYYAVFKKVISPEEVSWIINGVTNTEFWGVGETPVWNHDTPTKPDSDGCRYTFREWTPETVPVVKDNTYTYTAVFDSALQTYTCSFDANGGEMTAAALCSYSKGDTVTFPSPSKTGYAFEGWLIDAASGTWTAGTLIEAGEYTAAGLWGDISFTAQWSPVNYTISYSPASAYDVLPESKSYTIESTDTLPAASREGYDLAGWIVSAGNGTWTQGTAIAADYMLSEDWGDITLTPVWQIKTYIIHWISDGIGQTSEVEYDGVILSFPPLSKMGYTAEWDAEVPVKMPAHDLTFNAVYTPVQYYVRVDVNGGSAVDNFYYTINGDDVLPSPTREGATFAGWKVSAAQGNWSKNMLIPGGTSLNGKYGSVTLTAQWSMRTCTVIWEAGDITKTATWYYGAVPSYGGTPYKSPDVYNSYVFTGWDREITPVTQDTVTYTALFESVERVYTVTWNVDGVTTKQNYGYGDTPVYPGETPARAETSEYVFTFSGWSPELTEVKGDVTYIAQFDVFTKIQGLSLATSAVFLDIDEAETLKASIYPSTATVRDVVWTSLNPDVASVDNGTVTALKAGMAIIKVSSVDGSFSTYCAVTVNARITSYVEISAKGVSVTQLPGTSVQLYAEVKPDNASNPGIVWSSSSPGVASVSADGLVTFNTAGTAVITATSKDGYSSGSITVVTTDTSGDVKENENTYILSFAAAGTRFVINGVEYEALQVKVPEGESISFKINYPDTFYVNVNGAIIEPDADGVYRLENIDSNLVIITLPLSIGTDKLDENKDENDAPSFLAKIQAFFKKIVAFFRNLFK